MKRPPALVLALALVLVSVLAAAAVVLLRQRDTAGDNANGSVPVRDLDDLTGRWSVVNTQGAPRALVAPVELEVDGDRLSVRTGCNSGGGSASVEDSRLVLDGAGLAVTEMGCDEPRSAQERWVLEMLQARPRLERSGPYLYLHWGADEASWLGLEQQQPTS